MPVQRLQEEHTQSGEAANVMLQASIRIQQLRTTSCCLRSLIHKPDQRLKSIADEHGVAIQKTRVSPTSDTQPLVDAAAIRLIARIANQNDVRELLGDHGRAAIRRVTINTDDLEGNPLGQTVNGINAVPHQAASIVVRDDDRKIENRLRHSLSPSSLQMMVLPSPERRKLCVVVQPNSIRLNWHPPRPHSQCGMAPVLYTRHTARHCPRSHTEFHG